MLHFKLTKVKLLETNVVLITLGKRSPIVKIRHSCIRKEVIHKQHIWQEKQVCYLVNNIEEISVISLLAIVTPYLLTKGKCFSTFCILIIGYIFVIRLEILKRSLCVFMGDSIVKIASTILIFKIKDRNFGLRETVLIKIVRNK